jgi:hypothetical protein
VVGIGGLLGQLLLYGCDPHVLRVLAQAQLSQLFCEG